MVLIDQNKIDWCWLWFVWPVLLVQMTGVMVCVACVGGSDDWCRLWFVWPVLVIVCTACVGGSVTGVGYGLYGLCWCFR